MTSFRNFIICGRIRPATPPSGEIGITSLPVYHKIAKSLITQKRYEMRKQLITHKRCMIEQRCQFNAYRKSLVAFENLSSYLTSDPLAEKCTLHVTSGLHSN